MIRRAYIIGTVALGLVLTTAGAPKVCNFVSSARTASHYFQDLQKAGNTLNPIERVVFSLILANNKPPAAQQHRSESAPLPVPTT